jgi:hypothetical protein
MDCAKAKAECEDALKRCRVGEMKQAERRNWLRNKLDKQIVPITRQGSCVLSARCEKVALERRLQHMLGELRFQEWARTFRVVEHVPRVAYAFWHTVSKHSPRDPPESFQDGTASALRNSGLEVRLLGYQVAAGPQWKRGEWSDGAKFVDAGRYLERARFDLLLSKGVSVALVGDYIRLKAVFKEGGWLIDGDTVWLARAPDLPYGGGSPGTGHQLHSMVAPKTSPRGSFAEKQAWWLTKYCANPLDYMWISTPLVAPANSPVVESIVAKIEEALLADNPKAVIQKDGGEAHSYNYGMRAMQDAFVQWGLEGSIRPPIVASPVAPHARKAAILRNGGGPPLNELVSHETVCANNFWQSSKMCQGADSAHARGKRARVESGSLWAELTERSKTFDLSVGSLSGGSLSQAPAAGPGGGMPSESSLSDLGLGVHLWPRAPPIVEGVVRDFQRKWEVLGVIGQGVYGKVLRARVAEGWRGVRPRDATQEYALKVCTSSRPDESLVMEALLMEHCAHQCVAPIVDKCSTPLWSAVALQLHDGSLKSHCALLEGYCFCWVLRTRVPDRFAPLAMPITMREQKTFHRQQHQQQQQQRSGITPCLSQQRASFCRHCGGTSPRPRKSRYPLRYSHGEHPCESARRRVPA